MLVLKMGRNHLMMFGRGKMVSPKLLIIFLYAILIKTGIFHNHDKSGRTYENSTMKSFKIYDDLHKCI